MNKYKQLQKATMKLGIKMLIIVGAFAAVYLGAFMVAADAEKQKSAVESKYAADNTTLQDYQSQIAKSDEADKRYATIMAGRTSQRFSTDKNVISDWFRDAAKRFRLGVSPPPQLTPGNVTVSERPEFTNLPYIISLRKPMKFEFKAVSDTHVFSLIGDMEKSAPGAVRIDKLKLRRIADITDAHIKNIRSSGAMPLLVDATLELTWIGLQPKSAPAADGSSPPAPPMGN